MLDLFARSRPTMIGGDMRSVVFWALREAAIAAKEHLLNEVSDSFHCKGCDFYYSGDKVSYVDDKTGHVCQGCQKKLSQMFLQ